MKVYILAITCILPILAQNSLWNAIVQKEQILFDVDYNGRKFSVWKEDRGSFSRFYVTPLCELMRDSLSCQEDTYTEPHRHIFMFKVRVWNDAIVQKVQEGLKIIGTEASNSNILPLPMQKIKLDIKPDVTALYADRSWRSNQDQPNVIQFGLYVKSSSSCEKIMNDAIYNIEGFITKVRPVFEFSLTVGEQEYRNFSITGNEVASSSFYAKLNNSIDKDGKVYLTSDDMNKLSREILQVVLFQETRTAAYVPSDVEDAIIMELVNLIKEQKIQSDKLNTKEEWGSVFWDDIYTRPDIQTDYLNEVLKHNESTNHFKYHYENEDEFWGKLDQTHHGTTSGSSGGGGGFSLFGFKIGGGGSRNSVTTTDEHSLNETHTKQKEFNSTDELRSFLDKENVNSRWTGEKFEQKSMELYRVNARKLESSGQLLYKRVVLTSLTAVSGFEIKPETPWSIPQSTNIPPQGLGRQNILSWPTDLITIQNQVFAEGLNNEETAVKIHNILSTNYPRDKYFVAVWTRKFENSSEEARIFSTPEIADRVNLWEHEPVIEAILSPKEQPPKEVAPPEPPPQEPVNVEPPPPPQEPVNAEPPPPPAEENPPARRKRNTPPKRACLIYRSIFEEGRSKVPDYSKSKGVFENGRYKVPKNLPNFNATMDVWSVLRPTFNENFPFMAVIQWQTDVHATWYMSGEGMNVNDKYLLFVGFD